MSPYVERFQPEFLRMQAAGPRPRSDPRPRSKPEATAELVKRGVRPRLLDLELAAAYVDLSPVAFLNGVADDRYPQPIQDGRRQHWDVRALDAAVDRRSGLATSSGDEGDAMMRAIDAA
jgi:hypothetical protein